MAHHSTKATRLSYAIRTLPIEELALRWGEIEPLVRRATDRSEGCYEPVDVLGLAMMGRLLPLLVAEEGAKIAGFAAVEAIDLPRKRVGRIAWMGGDDLAGWGGAMIEAIEGCSRGLGCVLMIASGRKGWERIAMRYGYRYSSMGLLKPL